MSAGRRRGASLADEIAELLDARPSDPTAEEDEIGGGDGGFDERRELLADEDMPVQTGRRRIRGSAGLDLGDASAKYAGKVTSRAKFETQDSLRKRPQEEDEEDDDDEDDMDDNDDEKTMRKWTAARMMAARR